jgi:hypothetical protein
MSPDHDALQERHISLSLVATANLGRALQFFLTGTGNGRKHILAPLHCELHFLAWRISSLSTHLSATQHRFQQYKY